VGDEGYWGRGMEQEAVNACYSHHQPFGAAAWRSLTRMRCAPHAMRAMRPLRLTLADVKQDEITGKTSSSTFNCLPCSRVRMVRVAFC
jgi:hypothetical protein